MIDPATGSVDPQHLNPHIDYSELFTGPNPPPADQKHHSLATPLQMAVSSTGTVYVAAFGSAKIGVFSTATLEDPAFETNYEPATASANYIQRSKPVRIRTIRSRSRPRRKCPPFRFRDSCCWRRRWARCRAECGRADRQSRARGPRK